MNSDFLNSSPRLEQITQKALFLSHLGATLHACLPDNLRAHCQVAYVEMGVVILYVDSANWVTPLRYQLAGLLKALQQQPEYGHLSSIKVKVRPAEVAKETLPSSTPKAISRNSAASLHQTAEMLAEEAPELAAALERLAGRTRN